MSLIYCMMCDMYIDVFQFLITILCRLYLGEMRKHERLATI